MKGLFDANIFNWLRKFCHVESKLSNAAARSCQIDMIVLGYNINCNIDYTFTCQIAGKLLGKGGDKMRKLKEVAPKLFMSKNDEYFPNTDERVLFIGGSLDQVKIERIFAFNWFRTTCDFSNLTRIIVEIALNADNT